MRFFLAILTCLSLNASAQPTLKVELSRNLTGDVYYTIQYTVEGAAKVSSFTPPPFKGVDLLKGPEQTQGYSLLNGELQPYVSFIYVVRPNRTGRIVLDEAVAVADGKPLHSRTVELFAPGVPLRDAAKASPGDLDGYLLRKGEKVEDKLRGNLFVKLKLSRTKCYVGEPIIAEYALYTRLNSESRVVKRPSFSGFSIFDMAPQESGAVQRETLSGRVYDVYPLRKVMMYPLQAGTLTLDAMEVENLISFVDPDALGGGSLADVLRAYAEGKAPQGSVVKQKVVVSNPVQNVQVMALPETGKPAGYNGAVGRFTISAKLDHPTVEQGAVAYLDVTVAGQGNLPVLGKPTINFPAGTETFEDSIREEYNQYRDPEHWRKTFTVPFTLRSTGNVVIPAVKLVYFDPDSGHYRTAYTEPLSLKVSPSTGVKQIEVKPRSFWGGQTDKYWLWLPIMLVLGMIILFTVQRMREAAKRRAWEEEQRLAAEKEQAEQDLQSMAPRPTVRLQLNEVQASMNAGDAPAFYRHMERSLTEWCRNNMGADPVTSREACAGAWRGSGRSETLWKEMLALLRTAESARFDPLLDASGLADVMAHLESFGKRLGGKDDQSENL